MNLVETFEKIRDAPFVVAITDNVDGMSCTQKHLLLGKALHDHGYDIRYICTHFFWHELPRLGVMYPKNITTLAQHIGITHHLSCEYFRNETWALCDATWDAQIRKAGFPINSWNNCHLPIIPHNQYVVSSIDIYRRTLAKIRGNYSIEDNERRQAFYRAFNTWLECVRND